jgi:hypothetical protein
MNNQSPEIETSPVAQAINFPPAIRIGNRKFYKRRSLREYLAAISGELPPPSKPDDEYLINSRQLRQELGGVSEMWVWRREQERAAAIACSRAA